MSRDSLPPLLRGIGTTVVLAAAVVAFAVAGRDNGQARSERQATHPAGNNWSGSASDLAALSNQVEELRQEVEDENVAEEVIKNPWFDWLSFSGTAIIAGSFYTEWFVRKSANKKSAAHITGVNATGGEA